MFDCIVLCAGSGTRTHLNYNKIFYKVNNKPLYAYSVDLFLSMEEVNKVIIVTNELDYDFFFNEYQDNPKIVIVKGGKERSDSVYNGLKYSDMEYCLIHDGARPNITQEEVLNVYQETKKYQAAVLAVKAKDTIKEANQEKEIQKTLDRSVLYQMQTPQGVNRKMMLEGLGKMNPEDIIYDDVMVFEKVYGMNPKIVEGSYENIKVTTESDLDYIGFILSKRDGIMNKIEANQFRIGHSNDVHQLVEGRKLMLGGVHIPFEKGLLGHSDGDCVLHAVAESIIGALGLVDIGTHFSDKDPKYLNMDSSYFVSEAYKMMNDCGYQLNNIDIIIYLEKPILSPYKDLMREKIASLLHTDKMNVNVKATRKEGLGYIGEGKAIEAEAVALLIKK